EEIGSQVPHYILAQKVGEVNKTELEQNLQKQYSGHQEYVKSHHFHILRHYTFINGELKQIRPQHSYHRKQDGGKGHKIESPFVDIGVFKQSPEHLKIESLSRCCCH